MKLQFWLAGASTILACAVGLAETQVIYPGQNISFRSEDVSCYNNSHRPVEVSVVPARGGRPPGRGRDILVACQHDYSRKGCQLPDGSCIVIDDGIMNDSTQVLASHYRVPLHRISVINASTAHSTICGVFGGSSKTYRIDL